VAPWVAPIRNAEPALSLSPQLRCREIGEADLDKIVDLLATGFGIRSRHFARGVRRLSEYPALPGFRSMVTLEFNLDDYLTPATVDVWGRPVPRKLNLDGVPRHLLRRIKKYSEGKRGGIEAADPIAILAQLAKIAGLDRDQTAEAVTGIGERLAAAIKRFNNASAPSKDGPLAAIEIKRDR
jgi:hypothetical protein